MRKFLIKYSFYGLVLILCLSFSTVKHPYYIGLTELNYKTVNKELQISVRLFSHDLEEAMGKYTQQKIDLLNPKDKAKADSLLLHYINENLGIIYNQKKIHATYLGYEKEEESIWAYFELKNLSAPKQVRVTNTLLYNAFPNQTHIIRVKRDEDSESKKITNPEKIAEFIF